METPPFNFTPEQIGLLQSLAQKTGKSVSELLDQWLEGMTGQVRPEDLKGQSNGERPEEKPEPPASVLDLFRAAWEAIPEAELEDLPTDLAAQHDHYIYGTPKRPT